MRRPRTIYAFTLNELLIVIAIIVLLMAIAVPTLNVLSGSNSITGATNQVSSMLGQARAQAIGVQETRGVMFFRDPVSQRVSIAIVRDSGFVSSTASIADVKFLDLVPDMDFLTLPRGVDLQTIDNCAFTGTTRQDDAYIGFNNAAPAAGFTPQVYYGGVILFDSSGKLISSRYGFHIAANATDDPTTTSDVYTTMASLLTTGDLSVVGGGPSKDFVVPDKGATALAATTTSTYSQVGVALFDHTAFVGAPGTDTDVQITGGTYSSAELAEETWIDQHATVLLINRYNGSFIKTE